MDGFPLRSMTGRDHGGYHHFERHANASQVPEDANERLINAQDNATLSSEQPCGLSADCGTSTPFIPITEEEARRTTSLPELNFRPTVLNTWYLSTLMLWQFLCMGGVIALMVLGEIQPPWFRFGTRSSFWMWLYMPGLVGFLTTVSWRGTAQWYNRIIPYVRLANIPISSSWQDGDHPPKNLLNMSLNGVPSGNLNPEQIISLFKSGDYLSAVVNLTILGTWLLTPLKSSLFQLVEDGRGWQIHVSKLFGFVGLTINLWLLSTTFWIFFHLRSRQTGLKWNPAPLASQLCLLQGPNVFDSFEGIDYSDLRPLKNAVRTWSRNGLVLRLGYWKQEDTNIITHGVRFLPRNGPFRSEEQLTRREAHYSSDFELESYGTDIDRIWNLYLFDWYLIFTTAMGLILLAVAAYAWAKGLIFRPFSLTSILSGTLQRAIVFSLLPALAYGLFHQTFLSSDVYMRTVMPIQNMASPLPNEDLHRIFGPGHEILKGATAANSMLLDYLSPSVFGCIAQAIELGHYKIILGVVLATLSNSVYLVVARIFDFSEAKNGNYNVHIHARSFYASFGIMIIYCLSNWILRPRGPVRTCRPVYGLVDFASLVYRSDVLLCPEFWLQDSADTEEHMKAQVTLANRLYQYGIYHGIDGHGHVGIGVEYAPPTRLLDDDNIVCLERSVNLARAAIASGIYSEASLCVGVSEQHRRTRSNQLRSMSDEQE
ncbi:uncharacterized protein NECHADRAFT_86165 [Fusarium vanettenii 77-13-4]|uniref:Uncharacterized protein n=1 Tax=Fusarium vanettenii (strain ATCC MYA-4622 / CBS 123669 / FGSC 9596 / NRRL 45880 / 77-13-4) TaxID=660122 RepID=C7ZKI3_FUSV7|nr:uncharacterized protein NECHADRAFT_86165 [Fusarium vanettenii 77-13-4]EEU35410.1 predicted protein [Fusarium vanettenii 77-13-4]